MCPNEPPVNIFCGVTAREYSPAGLFKYGNVMKKYLVVGMESWITIEAQNSQNEKPDEHAYIVNEISTFVWRYLCG